MFVKSGSIYVKRRPKWSPTHILHISSNTFHQRKMLRFVIGEPHVTAATWTWPCTNLPRLLVIRAKDRQVSSAASHGIALHLDHLSWNLHSTLLKLTTNKTRYGYIGLVTVFLFLCCSEFWLFCIWDERWLTETKHQTLFFVTLKY